MLRLIGWLRKISLIGLIAAVLTPFVFRPFLSMGICAHHSNLVKAFSTPCPIKHQACGLICQLESQTREIDTRPENPSEYLSLSVIVAHASWDSAGMKKVFDSPPQNSKVIPRLMILRI
jgi:hypothetical protein